VQTPLCIQPNACYCNAVWELMTGGVPYSDMAFSQVLLLPQPSSIQTLLTVLLGKCTLSVPRAGP